MTEENLTNEKFSQGTCDDCGRSFNVEFGIAEAMTDHLKVFHGIEATWIDDAEIIE